MLSFLKRYSRKTGQRPGLAELTELDRPAELKIVLTDVETDRVRRQEMSLADLTLTPVTDNTARWIRVIGRPALADLHRLGEIFGLHTLTLEDIGNPDHRPKVEAFDEYIFVIARQLSYLENENRVDSHQVALVMGAGWVLSVEQEQVASFAEVHRRMELYRGRYLERGISYLLYALLDTVADSGFAVLDAISDRLNLVEQRLAHQVHSNLLNAGYELRRELILLESQLLPLRDVVRRLQRGDVGSISEQTQLYLRDVTDHVAQLLDASSVLQQMADAMVSTHLALSSQRSTEVMQTLTVIATIFIPLTFIVGIYGMNFEHMPELGWAPGYYVVWAVMIALGGGSLLWFRKRGWLSGAGSEPEPARERDAEGEHGENRELQR